ncbi:MAG: NAD(P)-binding protein [Acidobacteria bacterium]|nr:NAD(P)-binding protein [Acidobacteriota bacterium]
MGYVEISLKLPTDFTEEQLQRKTGKQLRLRSFSYQIERKSLDARKKSDIHWKVKVAVSSRELKNNAPVVPPPLEIPYRKRNKKVVVVGSGPAGFFAALTLQKAGFQTTVIERGRDVAGRAESIKTFENTGRFDAAGNYAFGEGGGGTFSDGKLTARSRRFSRERAFITAAYIRAGAPEEIAYLAHPHIGSDNLRVIVKNLRKEFIGMGGIVLFETKMEDLRIRDGFVTEAVTAAGSFEAEEFLLAPGHSAYETYRMLIGRGVKFRTKNFAVGCRVEHPQKIINLAQWGNEHLPGVKAAEYRLTGRGGSDRPVYTFCMCPGGVVVPSTAYANANIVNGMSLYQRSGRFANSACVGGIHPDEMAGRETTPLEALDQVAALEEKFHRATQSFKAPFCSILDFLNETESSKETESSYPLGLTPAPLWEMLPLKLSRALQSGLKEFSRQLPGFETGNLIGLESKTSSPIQVLRNRDGLCEGFKNLYLIGEGSGYAGGIVSSGVDGIRAALGVVERDQSSGCSA